jgi:integrative and conjugative element protein (TIGR02256 family)
MVHWFKRHPQFLIAEGKRLSIDPNYKEVYRKRKNLFVSHGYIIVRLKTIHKFPILIVYPDATPYVLPLIYPLKEMLSEELVESIAKASLPEVYSLILTHIQFHYELRHQNSSGNLCILEWDNLDDGPKFYGITTILKRVRDWCNGLLTGKFPPDSQEVQYYAHFIHVNYNYKFLYPQTFLNENWVEGEAYGFVFNFVPKGKYISRFRLSYFGCFITGKGKGGIFENVDTALPNFFYEEGIKNTIELLEKKDILQRLINKQELIKCCWFQISKEPLPFQTIEELITIIGEGDYNAGLKRILPFYLAYLEFKPNFFFIAIRFPNRKVIQEFQLFEVHKGLEDTGVLLKMSDEEKLQHIISSYKHVFAIPSEKFTDETFHLRNNGRAERNILQNKIVNVLGVGAIGSEIADSLGKAGVGSLSLFDNQEMQGPNPVRHIAGLEFVGVPKVEAVASILSNHNPYIFIKPFYVDINTVDLNDYLLDESIAISSIADDNIEGYLNERAVIANKIIYYIRALRGGKAARIFRVIPSKDACFNCLDLYRKDNNGFINIPEDTTLPTLKNECNNPVRPASAADLKLIAALATRIVLEELQHGFSANNHWIWSSEKLEFIEAFQMQTQSLPPHRNCYYCNHEKKSKVFLPAHVEKQMKELVAVNPGIETGGVLAGYIDDEGSVVITDASGPGPKAICLSTKFEKDVEYCQNFIDSLVIKSNYKLVYVGEWHSHPNERNEPSGTDIKSLTEIAFQENYLTDMPTMIIFSHTGKPSCTIHPAGKRFYFAELLITAE